MRRREENGFVCFILVSGRKEGVKKQEKKPADEQLQAKERSTWQGCSVKQRAFKNNFLN